MKRAILSVWNKSGLDGLGRALCEQGYELVSTGGTARKLKEAGLPVTEVSAITGFPEILDGRVKTLHPIIHGGILARRTADHLDQLADHDIAPIDIVVCNLYPFQRTIADPAVTIEAAIEQIDIGGVTLLRAAAKNHAHVAAVSAPEDYDGIIAELTSSGTLSLATRQRLAIKAFRHTADYDVAIANYMGDVLGETEGVFPAMLQVSLPKYEDLRYGENPHQAAATYMTAPLGGELLLGEGLSYNNMLDIDAAWRAASDFDAPTIAIIKHGTPTGIASADSLAAAFELAFATDTVSPFGGIIAANREVDGALVRAWGSLMVDAVVAPGFTDEALREMGKRARLRALAIDEAVNVGLPWEVRGVRGGVVAQQRDAIADEPGIWTVVSARQPTEAEWISLAFAWKVVKHVKSNAIVFGCGTATTGMGAGQMSRVDSVKLAAMKGGQRVAGSVMASDAFFPFPDGIEEAAKVGITAVIEPGGSVRDDEVVAAANALGLAVVFTGRRHFRH